MSAFKASVDDDPSVIFFILQPDLIAKELK